VKNKGAITGAESQIEQGGFYAALKAPPSTVTRAVPAILIKVKNKVKGQRTEPVRSPPKAVSALHAIAIPAAARIESSIQTSPPVSVRTIEQRYRHLSRLV
jgi:hypothetical protein